MAQPNYFTCTLGQASALDLTNKSFENISSFVDSQAHAIPSQPAVGFAVPDSQKPWSKIIYTFLDISQGTSAVAARISDRHGAALKGLDTVALICPSTPEFLFTWLALMRLGHAVLLIAPQCQPAAIAHLCSSCETTVLLHDEVYATQAQEAAAVAKQHGSTVTATALPFSADCSLSDLLAQPLLDQTESYPRLNQKDVAYLHHTSGTSSGVPKPIPQTHRAGAGVLPCFPNGRESATFTTTPLYHGGIADLLRAWTSGALIWLFPGKGVPITAGNIVKCLDVARSCAQDEALPPVKYFSSVPYVLQMMEADGRGLKYLQGMHIVGVGGAALPAEVGERLVNGGVNLISRFGSAECGFLMSSHREYEKDKEWQHLRSDQGAECLRFEKQEEGLSELVILHGWPHMAKRNRDDESFATADLFAPHGSIPNAWRYHSRADSQLTLITGKKFDPAPLEGAIAASDLLQDVLIFGNGQPFPGALLFREETSSISDTELLDKIWPVVEKLNAESQDHARIPRRMLIPMQALKEPLEKSSKGTVIRGAAETRFAHDIDSAYVSMSSINVGDVADDQVLAVLTDIVTSIVPKKGPLNKDTDLFSYGVDSVAGMQIRYGVRQLLPKDCTAPPLSVVEDCGTVGRLAEYVVNQRHGQELAPEEDEHELMRELVERYSRFETGASCPAITNGELAKAEQTDVVVLTGATGALGAHLLDLYSNREDVSKVYCLVRAADHHAARDRVRDVLQQRGLSPLNDAKVVVLQSQLGDRRLGLTDSQYDQIAKEASIIMHVAWSVNFRMRLRSFEQDNIASVTNLVNLALKSPRPRPPRLGFCSSVASVLAHKGALIPETIIDEPSAATPLGYSRSKWVAEQLCHQANITTPLQGRIVIFRVGQLSGDSHRGVWNAKEAWPMMLSTLKLTKTLPALENEVVNWLPVDIAARALMQGVDRVGSGGAATDVLHVLNENHRPEWRELLRWLQKSNEFDIVSPRQWVAEIERAESEGSTAKHPAFRLLGHWKRAYAYEEDGKHDGPSEEPENGPKSQVFSMEKTKREVPALRAVIPVDEEYFAKIWHWIDSNM